MLVLEDIITETPLPQVSDHLLYPWLLPGRLTLMVGPTNIGKTTLTLEIISQLLKGDHLWDRYPAKKIQKVLYLHGEHTIATLQEAAKARGDITPGAVKVIHEFGDSGSALVDMQGKVTPLYPQLKELVLAIQPQLLIAEPISAFLWTTENDNREVRTVISLLSSLGAAVEAAVNYLGNEIECGYILVVRPEEPILLCENVNKTVPIPRGHGEICLVSGD